MKLRTKVLLGVIGALVLLGGISGALIYAELRKASSDDPTAYDEDVARLIEGTSARPAPENAILFIGSSSIRLWSTLERDMAPLPIIQHGFGGSKLADIEHFAERLVNAFEPRAVVVFCGSNDISPGDTKPPGLLLETYRRFIARVRAGLPDVPIFYIGITPSPLRWSVWPQARETNELIREFSERDPMLFYIETGPALLGPDGVPDTDNYKLDRLHLSARGYAIWTEIIRTRLIAELGEAGNR